MQRLGELGVPPTTIVVTLQIVTVLMSRFILRISTHGTMTLDKRTIIALALISIVGLVAGWSFVYLFDQPSNQATVTGRLESGVEAGCVILRVDDGAQYLLTGWDNYPPVGTYVTVRGYIDNHFVSYCMQGSAAIHVLSLSSQQTTTSFTASFGTATASGAIVISGVTQQSTTIIGVPITASGYVYTVVESPQCYPQCGAPSFLLTYLYIPPGTECTGAMACYPPAQYYRLLSSEGSPFMPTIGNGTYVTGLKGLLTTPSSWNCESFYVPRICMLGDIYVQNL